MEALMQRNILQSRRVKSDYVRNTIFYGIVGILFTWFGISQLQWLEDHQEVLCEPLAG